MISVVEENEKMIEMPITLEPYKSYCNRLIEETHRMVKEMHDIVHCKDCKHSIPDMSGDELQGYECDQHYESYWDADDFCSRGEKK